MKKVKGKVTNHWMSLNGGVITHQYRYFTLISGKCILFLVRTCIKLCHQDFICPSWLNTLRHWIKLDQVQAFVWHVTLVGWDCERDRWHAHRWMCPQTVQRGSCCVSWLYFEYMKVQRKGQWKGQGNWVAQWHLCPVHLTSLLSFPPLPSLLFSSPIEGEK